MGISVGNYDQPLSTQYVFGNRFDQRSTQGVEKLSGVLSQCGQRATPGDHASGCVEIEIPTTQKPPNLC